MLIRVGMLNEWVRIIVCEVVLLFFNSRFLRKVLFSLRNWFGVNFFVI